MSFSSSPDAAGLCWNNWTLCIGQGKQVLSGLLISRGKGKVNLKECKKKKAHCQAENRKGTGRILTLAFMTLVVIETEPDISIEQFGAVTNAGFYDRDELRSS